MSSIFVQLNAVVVMDLLNSQPGQLSACKVQEYDYHYLGNDEPEYLSDYLNDEMKEITSWSYSNGLIKFLFSRNYLQGIFKFSGKLKITIVNDEVEGGCETEIEYHDCSITHKPFE